MEDVYFLYCNDMVCRVVEFYTGNEAEDVKCPACNNDGHSEAY